MDSDLPVQPVDVSDTKPSFRRPSNDAASRKYRRHSSGGGSDSSLSDGAPSPKHENRKRVKEERSHNSWRSGRESRSRDNYESSSYDKFSSAGYRAERRTRDDKSESRFHRSEHSRHDDRYSSKHQDRTERSEKTHSRSLKEAVTEYSGRRRDIDDRDRFHRPEERKIEKGSRVDHLEDSSSKKHKSSLFEKPAAEDVRSATLSRKETSLASGGSSSQAEGSQDVNAAKVAAMKAAELVNKNLAGCGLLSTAQKKKLLWGSKKNEPQEEAAGSRWDVPVFSDRDRQEKFNKLMGVKGEMKSTQECQPDEKEKELQMDLEKQYTAGLRRRDGRTVGLGL